MSQKALREYYIEFASFWVNSQNHYVGPFSSREEAETAISEQEKRLGCNFYPYGSFNSAADITRDKRYFILPASRINPLTFAQSVNFMNQESGEPYDTDVDLSKLKNRHLRTAYQNF